MYSVTLWDGLMKCDKFGIVFSMLLSNSSYGQYHYRNILYSIQTNYKLPKIIICLLEYFCFNDNFSWFIFYFKVIVIGHGLSVVPKDSLFRPLFIIAIVPFVKSGHIYSICYAHYSRCAKLGIF